MPLIGCLAIADDSGMRLQSWPLTNIKLMVYLGFTRLASKKCCVYRVQSVIEDA